MREFSTPLNTEIPATGNLTDDVVTNAREAADAVVFSRNVDGRVDRRHGGRVPRRGERRRQGPDGRGHRAGRPGRADLQDPLRVDAPRLRDLVRRRRHRAGLRDLLRRADRLDPRRLRARGPSSPRARTTWRASTRRASPAPARTSTTSGRSATTRSDVLVRLGPGHLRRGPRGASYVGHPPRPRHPDLHQRDDRPAQGLHAHPRQLHVRAGRRRRRAPPPLRHRGRLHAAVPAAGARLRPDHPGGRRQEAGPAGPQLGHQEPPRRPRGLQAHLHPRGPPGLREGLQHRLAAGHRRRPRQDLRPRRRDRHRLVASPGLRPRAAADQGAARAVRPARLRQAAHRPRRQAASTPSPAARRSATGSATSTAASA